MGFSNIPVFNLYFFRFSRQHKEASICLVYVLKLKRDGDFCPLTKQGDKRELLRLLSQACSEIIRYWLFAPATLWSMLGHAQTQGCLKMSWGRTEKEF
jgi:hypothetical protein